MALSSAAVQLLHVAAGSDEVPKVGLVFPSAGLRSPLVPKPLSDMALLAVLKRMEVKGITVHGFRSSFRDWSAEATDHPSEVAEMALSHKVADKVEAAYRRGDLFEKRRRLMEDWATWCAQPTKQSGGKVISISTGRAA